MRVHPTFWPVLAIAIVFGLFREFLLFFSAVTLHEMTHVIVGHLFHARATQLIITPLGEAAILKGLDRKTPLIRAIVILAGPIMNLTIGFLGIWLFNISDISMPDKGLGFGYFCAANIVLGIFNLLPAFPLDGGRFCQLILGNIAGAARANRLLCVVSRFVALLMVIIGIVQLTLYPFNMSLYCAGIYIIRNLAKERHKLSFELFCYFSPNRRAMQRVVPIKFFAVSPSMCLTDLIDCLRWDTFSVFKIYYENGAEFSFSEKELMRYIIDNGLSGRAGEMRE